MSLYTASGKNSWQLIFILFEENTKTLLTEISAVAIQPRLPIAPAMFALPSVHRQESVYRD